ncbi:MAG TPA: hypothetical protein VFV75_08050, partial [Candidatus Polarisedimenticolaceae bacterium]|nr:hypothetical protein [Candidatus Polarisedimenticolaceae bacterium]
MRIPPLLLLPLLLGCPRGEPSAHETALRALHAKVLRAHLASDIDLLLEDGAPQGTIANRGVVSRTSEADARRHLGPYLAATTFREYRDL